MKRIKYLVAIVLSFALMSSTVTLSYADNNEVDVASGGYTVEVDPETRDTEVSSEEEVSNETVKKNDSDYKEAIKEATNFKEAAQLFKEHYHNREKKFTIVYKTKNRFLGDTSDPGILYTAIYDVDYFLKEELYEHNGNPLEGDAIKYNFGTYKVDGTVYTDNTYSTYQITYSDIEYYTSKAEEEKLTKKVNEVLDSLNIKNASEYNKIHTIYNYIMKNVKYDTTHQNDTSYNRQYTAYGALVDKKAVCQGFSLLLYRLLLEVNVDNRIIFGYNGSTSKSVTIYSVEENPYYVSANHSWNIVKLNNKYYNVDVTWDTTSKTHTYFLKSNSNFPSHTKAEEFAEDSFAKKYVISATDDTTNIKLNTNKATIKVGNSTQLKTNKSNNEVTWKSSNTSIATVSNGKVTGKKAGNVKIYAILKSGQYNTVANIKVENKAINPSIKLSATSYTYNGKVRKPTVKSVTYNKKKLSYKVTYSNKNSKNVGEYTLTVSYKGGSKKLTYKINPVSTSITKSRPTANTILLSWKKQKSVTGYQIQYSKQKNFKKVDSITISDNKKVSQNIMRLSRKTNYYIRIRTFKKVNNKIYYSSWSKTRTTKTR